VKCLPERGRIGIFNRSYYEETLVVRVHPELLAKQKIPQQLITKDIWDERYRDIRHFERYLTRNGVIIRKFFLHISADEQKNRFLERLDNSAKNWKVSATDSRERHRRAGITEPPVSRNHCRTAQGARCGKGSTDCGRRTLKSNLMRQNREA
jgi:polyphosphate kinase 2 (PPK2 family)